VERGFKVSNGVKQGDALSCSLFLLAIEPVIRNLLHNDQITSLHSNRLNYTWPKVMAYADDITIIANNETNCVRAIFSEYEKLTSASGLMLNADKTERYDLNSGNIPRQGGVDINYMGTDYTLVSQPSIKINGIMLARDTVAMQNLNYDIMTDKMIRHFRDWSRRSLSILGKIQIIKTFGLSQYLYMLMATDLSDEQWTKIERLINKFLWNRNFNAPTAPHRISRSIINTTTLNGRFGMVNLKEVVQAARLRRFAYHMENTGHPIRELQMALGAGEYLKRCAALDIEDVTSAMMVTLTAMQLKGYAEISDTDMEYDTVLQRQLLGCPIRNMVSEDRQNSIESLELRRRGCYGMALLTLLDDAVNLNLLLRICHREISIHLRKLGHLRPQLMAPDAGWTPPYLYDSDGKRWIRITSLTSKQIREANREDVCLRQTKLLDMTESNAMQLYQKLSRLKSVPNRATLYRLIHGDVYCMARTYRFGLTDNDRCVCCFEEGTIKHLLLECSYTQEVWTRLRITYNRPKDILNGKATVGELEIRAALIAAIVFGKKTYRRRYS
jgi:hypothetical protein